MIAEIVFFGDSWPRGAELELEIIGLNDRETMQHSFPKFVGDMLGIPSRNYSASGSSIPFLVMEFGEFLTDGVKENTLAIFCVTSPDRFYWQGSNGFANIGPGNQDSLAKFFYADAYSDQGLLFYNSMCLEYLNLKCEKLGILPMFIPVFDTPDKLIKTPDSITWLSKTPLYSMLLGEGVALDQVIRQHPLVRPCHRHPNTRGHKYLAEKISKLLKENTIC